MFTFARVALDGARSFIRGFGADERAQDLFEYVLIVGVLTVAVLAAVATPLGGVMITAVMTGVCDALDMIDLSNNGGAFNVSC